MLTFANEEEVTEGLRWYRRRSGPLSMSLIFDAESFKLLGYRHSECGQLHDYSSFISVSDKDAMESDTLK